MRPHAKRESCTLLTQCPLQLSCRAEANNLRGMTTGRKLRQSE